VNGNNPEIPRIAHRVLLGHQVCRKAHAHVGETLLK
jgi:hypothetical protein